MKSLHQRHKFWDFKRSCDPNILLIAITLTFSINGRWRKVLHSVLFTLLILTISCLGLLYSDSNRMLLLENFWPQDSQSFTGLFQTLRLLNVSIWLNNNALQFQVKYYVMEIWIIKEASNNRIGRIKS